MQLPNVWGDGGALFAYSGMDGETDWHNPLVGSTLEHGRGFVFHTDRRPILRFGIRSDHTDCTGDVGTPFERVVDELVGGGIVVSRVTAGGATVKLEYVFANKDTVGARVTAEELSGPVEVFLETTVDDAQASVFARALAIELEPDYFALESSGESAGTDAAEKRAYAALSKPGQSALFAWAYSPEDVKDAAALVTRALDADFDALIDRQMEFYRKLPAPKTSDEKLARTYYKSASVMKVNCYSPQGRIPFRWTTPDRWPHRHMWIWDSAFHAIGLRHFAPQWAEDAIKAVLSTQRENGFIPHTMTPDSSMDSNIIQPPILAWAAWKVYEKTQNREFLQYVYPRIGKMLRYDSDALDEDGNGLSNWENGFASGMDNSPRFDQPIRDAIDLNSYIVNDMRWLGKVARELSKDKEAADWQKQADERTDRVNSLLWDDATGFYYDAAPDGSLTKVKTEAGFAPLLARICSQEQAESLVKHLTNPDEFWRAFPVSSVAGDEPTFCDNMWRGPVWLNFNYFVIEGLRHYGYRDIANELRRKTIEEISRWYQADGLIYEYYDSEGKTDPVFLHRKRLGGPQAVKSAALLGTTICDYNWSAAVFIDLLQSE